MQNKKRKYGTEWKNVTVNEAEVDQMNQIFDRFIAKAPITISDQPLERLEESIQESLLIDPSKDRDQQIESAPLDQTQFVEKEFNYPGNNYPGNKVPSTATPVINTPVIITPVVEKKANTEFFTPNVNSPGYFMPNWIPDQILPTLSVSEQSVYLRLIRLTLGFNRLISDSVGVTRLAEKTNLTAKTIKTSMKALADRGLIRIHRDLSGDPTKGNKYEILIPKNIAVTGVINTPVTITPVIVTPIKRDDHDDPLKEQSSQAGASHHETTIKIYCELTTNKWTPRDDQAYAKVAQIGIEEIRRGIRSTLQRAPKRPKSFAYFVPEILSPSVPNPVNLEMLKKKYRQFIAEIREANIGGRLTLADLVGTLKDRLVQNGLPIDEDLINQALS